MKKTIGLIIVFCMVLSMVGCNLKEETSGNIDKPESSQINVSSKKEEPKDESKKTETSSEKEEQKDESEKTETSSKKEYDNAYVEKITNPNMPVFDGAGYNYNFISTIKESGSYTIIDQKKDDLGNLWGKLKSGYGWVNLTLNRNDKNLSQPVKLYGLSKSLKKKPYHSYNSNVEYGRDIAFIAVETVTDFEYIELLYDAETGERSVGKTLKSIKSLTPNKYFVTKVEFFDIYCPTGIKFTDSLGKTRYFEMFESGRDGSIIFTEITVK